MAGIYNFSVNQGATKRFSVTYKDSQGAPINLTGYQGRGQIKLRASDPEPIASFTVTVTDPALGIVDIELASTALQGLVLRGKGFNETTDAFYDIEMYNGNEVIRLLNGVVSISPEITK
jgi:hypothetical protein